MQLLEKLGVENFYNIRHDLYDFPFLDSSVIPRIVDIECRQGMYRPSSKIIGKYESWIPYETVQMLESFESKYAYNKLLYCYTSIPKRANSDTDYNYSSNLTYLPALLASNYNILLPIMRHDYPIWHDLFTKNSIPSKEAFKIDCKNICVQLAAALCYLNEQGFDSTTLTAEYGDDFSNSYEDITREIKYSQLKSTIIRFEPKDANNIFILKEVFSKKTYKSAYDYLTSKSEEEIFKDVTFYGMSYGYNSFHSSILYNKNIAIIHISDRSANGTIMIKIINGKVYRQVLNFTQS
jgi:hypothetical protein